MHINCDMGEGYGRYTIYDENNYMPFISACNIACGYHAGDASTIRKTIEAALHHSVEIGCHPSYPDRQGFGRRYMQIPTQQLTDMICYQISAVIKMTESMGGVVTHIKPHGALYNSAVDNSDDAEAIIDAIRLIDSNLTLFTLPFGKLFQLADERKINVRPEGFIDRRYESTGRLVSRKFENSVLTDPVDAAAQAIQFWEKHTVNTIEGDTLNMKVKTLCIHGDNPNALDILKTIDSR